MCAAPNGRNNGRQWRHALHFSAAKVASDFAVDDVPDGVAPAKGILGLLPRLKICGRIAGLKVSQLPALRNVLRGRVIDEGSGDACSSLVLLWHGLHPTISLSNGATKSYGAKG
jgi:hypothetical protein